MSTMIWVMWQIAFLCADDPLPADYCRVQTNPPTTGRCGLVAPAPILCADTSTCDSNNNCRPGGYAMFVDALFTSPENLPIIASNPSSGSIWEPRKRWCTVQTACQVKCVDNIDGTASCVSDLSQVMKSTQLDYWVQAKAPNGANVSCPVAVE